MSPRPAPPSAQQGVALVTTVIVVAVLAMVAVAFMQSTTVDRFSARSVANYYRARLAADAGLAAAAASISTNATNDTFIIVANTNQQLFVGNGIVGSTNFSYTPLFSVVSNLATAVSNVVTNGVPAFMAKGATTNYTNWMLPGGLSISSPVITWVYLTNSSGQTNARFAYWFEDLGGRLDLGVVGTNDATAGRRPTGTNAGEIALWSLFNPGAPSDTGNAVVASLVAARSNLLTAATASLVNPAVTTNLLADLAAGLRQDTNEPELIPFGFNYPDQGKVKYNLNTNITAAGVSAIATIINRNLPNFGTRGGALNASDYVNNIAASIVDYADADSTPTGDDTNYFGVENIPWPNELFDRITFSNVTTTGLVRLLLKDYVEVWNMGNTNTAETTISIDSNYDLVLTFSNTLLGVGFQKNLNSLDLESGSWGPRDFLVPALQPNEYKVVDSSTDPPSRRLAVELPNPAWYSTAPVRTSWRVYVLSNTETKNLSYTARVGGKVVQRSKGGRWPRYLKSSTPLTPPSGMFIFCNPIGFASQTASSSSSSAGAVPAHSGGDPRAQFFLSDPLRSQNYLDESGGYASPGGRNWEKANIAKYPECEVSPGKFWPDNGHAADADRGWNAASYSTSPTTNPIAPLTTNWVMFRNDTGVFTNVCELGNIFDPMQWSDQSGSAITGQPGLWTNLTAAATPDARFGGRNTLRVGRWEFTRLTNNGTRASQLLDIFAVGTNTSGAVTNRIAGRINLNTASTNALRALAAGVGHITDAGLKPDGTNFFVPAAAVASFTNAVMTQRTNKPFFSTSELAILSTNGTGSGWPASAVFGNTNVAGVTEWNDAAAQEWFSKIYPLATVRSRNFLVHVVGQAMQTNGTTVLSTAKRTYQLYVQPVRATSDTSAGLTTNCVPRVLATWDL